MADFFIWEKSGTFPYQIGCSSGDERRNVRLRPAFNRGLGSVRLIWLENGALLVNDIKN